MVGSPPEALKVLNLWELPQPAAVVLPPDPLFCNGINQASFEFLLYNHLFIQGGLARREPFELVCDEEQAGRVTMLLKQMLHGPDRAELLRLGTSRAHADMLLSEIRHVNEAIASRSMDDLVRVTPFRGRRAVLRQGARLTLLPGDQLQIEAGGETVQVARVPTQREPLPLYFADVERPLVGPRFGIQVIGSASGFSGAEWSSCYIIWINGLPLIIDGTPYLDEHLARLGVENDHILGYVITHNHEDHANAIGQLISTRRVTILTSDAVMSSLVVRLTALLDCPESEVRALFQWVKLRPGFQDFGEPLHWYGADIRSWYTIHTIPTLGLDFQMGRHRIRMSGDTLWGAQLDPLVQQGLVAPGRAEFIRSTYNGADVLIADAGGGSVHPDPGEVQALIHNEGCGRVLVTHVGEDMRSKLPAADPGTSIALVPGEERSTDDATALFASPLLRDVPERWLLALLQGGELVHPPESPVDYGDDAIFVVSGLARVESSGSPEIRLERGDLFHPELASDLIHPRVTSAARWTRLLRLPAALFKALCADTGCSARLRRLYESRSWWKVVLGQELGLESLVKLADRSRLRQFQPGEIIVKQGDPAHTFYVVTAGEVRVVREQCGDSQILGQFGAGFHFGEIALLEADRRTASVISEGGCTALEVPARLFKRELMEIPAARYRICQMASDRRLTHIKRPPRQP